MQETSDNGIYLLSIPSEVKSLKDSLSEKGLFSKSRGIQKYICTSQDDESLSGLLGIGLNISLDVDGNDERVVNVEDLNVPALSQHFSGYLVWTRPGGIETEISHRSVSLPDAIGDFIAKNHPIPFTPANVIPNRYTIYGSMALFSSGSFTDSWWSAYREYLGTENLQEDFFRMLADILRVSHIATNAPISEEDTMRRPTGLIPLYGDFGNLINTDQPTGLDFQDTYWVKTKQNGIYQVWAPLYTMFSRGNVKEKARVLDFPQVNGNVIVDLYAGIGYFTFSYMRAGALLVLCWEVNPWSVQGLVRGARANKWTCKVIQSHQELDKLEPGDQIVVFQEDNNRALQRIHKLVSTNGELFTNHPISHINMGLLPSSQPTWQPSVQIGLLAGGYKTYLHIHENVDESHVASHKAQIMAILSAAAATSRCPNHPPLPSVKPIHVEKIKTFAPGIWHICFDFALYIPQHH